VSGRPGQGTENTAYALEFDVLGPLTVRSRFGHLEPGTPRQRAILALLLVNVGRVVPVETIVDMVWGDSPPASVTSTLQAYVSRLRRVFSRGAPRLGGQAVLPFRSRGYQLNVAPDQVISHRFEEAVNRGVRLLRDDELDAADRCLDGALRMWRSRPYADLADYAFVADEVFRLEQLRISAVEGRARAGLLRGADDFVTGLLSQELLGNPLNERLVGHLMLALARSGRRASALQLYERTRVRLAEELGVGVGAGLRELHAAILRQEPVASGRAVHGGVGARQKDEQNHGNPGHLNRRTSA
jgi:DNA-binding SARP family transcriptional activator